MLALRATLTLEQGQLVCDLNERGSMDSLTKCVQNKELARFQTQTVAFAAIIEKCLISLDTGLGKTLAATGLINIISALPENTGMRWLVAVQNNNLLSTYKKIQDGLSPHLRICCSNADNVKVMRQFMQTNMYSNDVFVLSYEALCNETINDFIYELREEFNGMIIDECHMLSNLTSTTSRMTTYILQCMRYRYLLSATPMRVSPYQVINLMYMMDPEMFTGVNLKQYKRQFTEFSDGKIAGYKDLEFLHEDIMWRFVGTTRKDLGMKGDHQIRLLLVDPLPEYYEVKKMDVPSLIKGDYGGPAMTTLMQLACDKAARGEKGVAYINRNVTKDAVYEFLTEAGLRVGILDGQHTNTNDKKEEVHQAFMNNEYDILLTNITTGRDLQCEYLVFYEQTFDFQQFLGRGERGLVGNDLEIVFILVKDTEDISYFHDNVLARALMLECIGGKDVEAVKEAYNQLRQAPMIQITQMFGCKMEAEENF